ncbi:DUF6069 family protein [Cellulomonas composti]|uniref:Uncharacterized protein n=1 Tax=Cellulomonas composti TaxID=266130 RepID=A0A511JBZ2_9CELL|nr:DUF6069 family protein [Cellulomonas composti]GEL95505.1 hypothetical protein CCO02nite_21630 [Cellulomonas composti]
MTYPTDPPRHAAPGGDPAGVPPVQPLPPAVPPASPFPTEPAPAAAGRPAVARLVVRAGRYWAGVAATALVAALVGIVGVLVFQEILEIDLLIKGPFADEGGYLAYASSAVLATVAAGALLHLFALTTPRPTSFFGWIMALATLVAALLPLSWAGETDSKVCTGATNLLIGIAIWSLLAGVLHRTSAYTTS